MSDTCTVEGCDSSREGRSFLCGVHGRRKRMYGSPNVVPLRTKRVKAEDRVGQVFGDLLVVAIVGRNGSGHAMAEVECQTCWATRVVQLGSLVSSGVQCREEHEPTYSTVHHRLAALRGAASDYECDCGEQAAHWAYMGDPLDERIEPVKYTPDGRKRSESGSRFSPNPWSYRPLCRRCHSRLDRPRDAAAALVSALRSSW